MPSSDTKSTRVLPAHSYADSAELKFLYGRLYPPSAGISLDGVFHAFVQSTQSSAKLTISNPAPRASDLAKEGDFLLRQFLWFIRPAPDFVAYPEFFRSWQSIFARRHTLGIAHLLPWVALNQMAGQINIQIASYMASCTQQDVTPALFPKYAVKQSAKGKRLANPMKGHSSADFPLYTLLLEHP